MSELTSSELTVSEKILIALFESEKTTRNLVEELGYSYVDKNNKKIFKYNNIADELKKLERKGYLKSEKKKPKPGPGNIPTIYKINFEDTHLTEMITEYPRLLPIIQKKEDILHLIVDKHKSALFDNSPRILLDKYSYPHEAHLSDLIFHIFSEYNNWLFKKEKEEELKKEFLKRLQLSLHYFELYLTQSVEAIKEYGKRVVQNKVYFTSPINKLGEKIRSKFFLLPGIFVFDLVFEYSVELDRQQGNLNEEAIEYLKSRKMLLEKFNDNTVGEMDKIFMKHHRLLNIAKENLEDSCKEELELLYKYILFEQALIHADTQKYCKTSEEDRIGIFQQLIQESKLDRFLEENGKNVKFLNSL